MLQSRERTTLSLRGQQSVPVDSVVEGGLRVAGTAGRAERFTNGRRESSLSKVKESAHLLSTYLAIILLSHPLSLTTQQFTQGKQLLLTIPTSRQTWAWSRHPSIIGLVHKKRSQSIRYRGRRSRCPRSIVLEIVHQAA